MKRVSLVLFVLFSLVTAKGFTQSGNLNLGNLVWNDFDGDGKKDPNEPGLGNVPVSLYTDNDGNNLPDGAAVASTVSDLYGKYSFPGLAAGRYIASMPLLPGFSPSPNSSTQNTSPFPDNNVDNDNNIVHLVSGVLYTNAITLAAGSEPATDGDGANGNLTLDLAQCGNSYIGDFVWDDLNGNGIQDAGEPGINGVNVTVTFEDGTTATVITTTYNAANNPNAPQYDGYYNFRNLGPGTYKITFQTPAGYNSSPANQGSDDAKDSDPLNGGPVFVTIAANESNFTIDAGFTKKTPPAGKLRLGNQVWNDFDGDGRRDSNEPAIGGAPISLYTDNNADNLPDGPAIRTTNSDANGRYLFSNLAEGRYIASMPILPGYQQSPNTSTQAYSPYPDLNNNDTNKLVRLVGPNGPGGVVYTNAITLTEGDEPTNDGDDANGNLTFDLAECGNAFLGDFVWNDLNGNGIQDAGEPGINGVNVTITFEDGTTATVATATYNAANNLNAPQYDGYYNFKNLGPGTYKITFQTPAGYTSSPANQGSNDAKDSDPLNGGPVFVTISANQSDFTIDAGFTKKAPPAGNLRLGNQVWNDFDGDGRRDPNEPAIAGAPVSLYTDNNADNLPDGPAIKTTMSDSLGRYLFTGLPAGRYIASMPILPGYQMSPNTSTQAYSPYPDLNTNDTNKLVRLVGPNGPGGVVYTNAITLSAGDEPTNDGDDANGNLTFDLAECGNSFIGDFVWNDLNGNGIQDAGEPGINGVLVTITFEDGTTATASTLTYNAANNLNAPQYDGYYNFRNLGPGTYKIRFTTPAGYNSSPANQGGNDAKDSDPVNGGSVTVTIAANQSDFTIDAGFTKKTPPAGNLRLGNQVWNDFDGDGRRDPNEPAIAGAPVSLYTDNNADNLPDGPAVKTTMSDSMGHYLFTGLSAGRYIASMPVLPGYQMSPNTSTQAYSPYPDLNNNDTNKLVRLVGPNGPGGVVYTNAITLSAGGEPTNDGDDANGNLTFDLAECGNSFIGDFVWKDLNGNGIQDAGEPGINGVNVTITFEDGTTATVTTATYNAANNLNAPQYDGYYNFKNLGPGTYKITFQTPAGYTPTVSNAGVNDALDSDPVNGDVFVTIDPNESDFTIDAGFVSGSGLRLGNLVWNDLNTNGIKDADEPGISGLTVKLYRDTNGDNIPDAASPLSTTTTANGLYGFTGLSAGNYIVSVVVPTGYLKGAAIASGNNPNNDIDNDNNGVTLTGGEVRTNFITLSAGGEPVNDGDNNNGNQTLDIALKGNASIGDYVWCDLNKNGLQDFNEVGIANVMVKLIFPDGTVKNANTNTAGKYIFSNLGPGNYKVQFITPLGMTPSPANVGNDDTKDSDPVNGEVAVTLAANEVNTTIDAGFYKSACISSPGTCGPGYLTLQTSLLRNGDFSSSVTSPAAGNVFTGNSATTGVTYNFSSGSFLAQAEYKGQNVKPAGERGFSIINTTSAFTAAGGVNQLPFPGDPANSVASTGYFMYHNGNNLGGDALIWQQTATGLVIGKTYRFRFYVSNMYEPSSGLNSPSIKIVTGGTNGIAAGTAVTGPVTIDEASTSNASALNGWKRVEYSFTATSVAMTFKIVDASAGSNGDELGLTAIGIEICEKDTDGDCLADVDDIDDDNDGILDVVENGGYDALHDCDNDGIPNYLDTTPGCTTASGNDVYGKPFKPLTFSDCNSDGINDFFDWDRDGIINELDLDSDNDGILDVQETRDPKATDNNRDGMVDGIDTDNDGLLSTADANDNDPTIAASIGLIPQDLDRDGTPNYLDLDSDGDGIVDNREALELDVFAAAYNGLANGTNDSDHDGVRTVNYTANDNDADNFDGFGAKGILLRDNDGDGFPNPYDIDIDNDGITDNVEGQPTCSEKQPSGIDSDGDGLDDAYDTDLNSCVKKAPGITPYDKESDGTPDIRDLDTDNDGAPDINEGSGIYGNFVTNYNDTDGDGLIDQFDVFNIKTAVTKFVNNVVHSEMGLNGSFNGPVPSGSNAPLPQSVPGVCPNADRDWRNVALLPVKLVTFTGTLQPDKTVTLKWTVANEINMDRYVVERSTNGRDFTEAGSLAARGSSITADYTFNDNVASMFDVTLYYRLKEVEKTGSSAFSNIITFKLNDKAGTGMAIYPNPSKDYFVLKIHAVKEGSALVRLMDATGKTLLSQNRRIAAGTNAATFNEIKKLAAGAYNVQVIIDGQVFNQRLIISR